jgi:hypothetical protein
MKLGKGHRRARGNRNFQSQPGKRRPSGEHIGKHIPGSFRGAKGVLEGLQDRRFQLGVGCDVLGSALYGQSALASLEAGSNCRVYCPRSTCGRRGLHDLPSQWAACCQSQGEAVHAVFRTLDAPKVRDDFPILKLLSLIRALPKTKATFLRHLSENFAVELRRPSGRCAICRGGKPCPV